MGGHSSSGGQDTLGDVHTLNIFRGCLKSDEDAWDALLGPGFGVFGGEHALTHGGTWGGTESLSEWLVCLLGFFWNDWVKQLVDGGWFDSEDGLFLGD